MIKTVVSGIERKSLDNPMSSGMCGHPISKDIVKNHKAANIKSLGYTHFGKGGHSKVSIKSGQK